MPFENQSHDVRRFLKSMQTAGARHHVATAFQANDRQCFACHSRDLLALRRTKGGKFLCGVSASFDLTHASASTVGPVSAHSKEKHRALN